jgi:two-component system sporulation sensor kinase A
MKLLLKILIPIATVLVVSLLLARTLLSVSLQRLIIGERVAEFAAVADGQAPGIFSAAAADAETAFGPLALHVLQEHPAAKLRVWDPSAAKPVYQRGDFASEDRPSGLEGAFAGGMFGEIEADPSGADGSRLVDMFVPIRDREAVVRYVVEICLPFEAISSALDSIAALISFFLASAGLLILAVIFVVNHFFISRPVAYLTRAIQRVADEDLEQPIRLLTPDEFGVLAHEAETMRLRLRAAFIRVRQEEDRYRRIVELSPDAIAVHQDGKFVFANAVMARLLKAGSPAKIVGKPIFEILHPDFHEIVRERVRREMELGEVAPPLEEKFIRFDGSVVDVEAAGTPIVYDGKPAAQIAARDITERKRGEARVRELDELKNAFVRIVAHQLRTPLSGIRWNLEALLLDSIGKLTKAQKDFVRVTYEADVEVIRRIQDMLVALDIEEGRSEVRKNDTALDSLLSGVVEKWKKLAALKKVRMAWKRPAKALPPIKADAEKMREVFEKIIENAVAYTPAGGSVSLDLRTDGAGIRFTCADTGAGIPAVEQGRVFTRFFRGSNASVLKTDASGLGLFIAQHLVSAHGGKIEFVSEEGKGSTFSFAIPTA